MDTVIEFMSGGESIYLHIQKEFQEDIQYCTEFGFLTQGRGNTITV